MPSWVGTTASCAVTVHFAGPVVPAMRPFLHPCSSPIPLSLSHGHPCHGNQPRQRVSASLVSATFVFHWPKANGSISMKKKVNGQCTVLRAHKNHAIGISTVFLSLKESRTISSLLVYDRGLLDDNFLAFFPCLFRKLGPWVVYWIDMNR